jgi:hypothetical protein
MITVRTKMSLSVSGKGRKRLNACGDKTTEKPTGRIPRISRLMALAIKYQGLLDRGEVESITELAKLCHVTQPRMSQILSLNLLSPMIQERLLFLPMVENGKTEVHEKILRSVCAEIDWRVQELRFTERFCERVGA